MSEQTNLALVQSAYAAFGRGDLPALLACLSADVQWDHPGPSGIPWAGAFKGREGVQRFFAGLAASVDFESFAPEAFIADGDRVVVLGRERARVKRNGQTYETAWAHAFELANGKIAAFREYTDTAGVASALSAKSA